ncbi:T9SS type A sorting domain-containing protein [candidate division KSB1 bacterium]|nr:T9SS type A sorting domain-containing protein [candidate division KSB1 bacterium]
MKYSWLAFLLLLASLESLQAQSIHYGLEFQVNATIDYDQEKPAIALLPNGGFVVCWQSWQQDGSESGIFAQLFDASGNKSGSEFQVNSISLNEQENASVATFGDENFVICWQSLSADRSNWSIMGQLFDASGNKKGNEFRINTYSDNWQNNPDAAAMQNGGFVLCWESLGQDGSDSGIFVQLFDASGNRKGQEFQVNSYIDNFQERPVVAPLMDGGFVIVWISYDQDGSGYGIFGQIFNASGNKRGVEFQANTYTKEYQFFPTIAGLSDSEFVICWQSSGQDGSYNSIFGQRFDYSGSKLGEEFQVNTTTPGSQTHPAVRRLETGGFVVCWCSEIITRHSYWDVDISGQLFDATGSKIGHEFHINDLSPVERDLLAAMALKNGSYIVCWKGNDGARTGIFAKYLLDEPIVWQLNEFSLIEPQNDATLNTTKPIFSWRSPGNFLKCYFWEISYDLYLASDFHFTDSQIFRDIYDTTYTIDSLAPGQTYFWKVLAKNIAGDSLWSNQQDWGFFIKHGATGIGNEHAIRPNDLSLLQNFPNPFNPATEIRYNLPAGGSNRLVSLTIYDVLGRQVKGLVEARQSAGQYKVTWDGTDMLGQRVPSGVYVVTVQVGNFKQNRKMILMK